MVYNSTNGKGQEIRTISLTTHISVVALICTIAFTVVGFLFGQLHAESSMRAILETKANKSDVPPRYVVRALESLEKSQEKASAERKEIISMLNQHLVSHGGKP